MTTAVPAGTGTGLPQSIVAALARHGDAPAAITVTGTTSYRELAERVARTATALGTERRLVAVEGRRDVAWLVGYLGALAAGCPVLLVPATTAPAVLQHYEPDVRLTGDGDRVGVEKVRARSAHELHPDLALLLSTSGTTGSPKTVRLSYDNLLANAGAVAESLGVRRTDRAATTLPVEYCYGLSVVHSHLLRGAALLLTELSVSDLRFWDLFRDARATSFAGVPYTFDLLDAVGFEQMDLPDLRYVTQAGGRLDPARVRRYAELGLARGWDLFVMYGQTEATARMAVLPPDLARTRPTSIGRPVPGGRFRVEPVGDEAAGPTDVGELVYEGPNVMLGYASRPADLALGRTVEALHTGDLARRCPDGLYEVVGRRSRFTKLLGLRVDLGHLEDLLRADGLTACCEGTPDGRLGVVVEEQPDVDTVLARVTAAAGLPRHAVRVVPVAALPRGAAGKVDHGAVRAALADRAGAPSPRPATDVRTVLSEVLGRRAGDDDTFVSLGGDSLSYVEVAVALERLVPRVPADWHTRPVRELEALARARTAPSAPRTRPSLDTTVALRALAILLIVGSHADLFRVLGGAHVLLVVAGYNLARFQLCHERRARVRHLARSLRRIVVPTVVWVAAVALLSGAYGWRNVLLLNHALGPQEWGPTWRLWFVEALVVLVVLVGGLLTLPLVDRWHRDRPYLVAMALCGAGLLVHLDVVPVPTGPSDRFTAQAVLWLFALGMAAAAAHTRSRKALVAVVAAVGLHGWFDDVQRELVVLGGVVLLLTVRRVPSSALMTKVASALASASLYVYVTHWQVYPVWEDELPLLAVVASLVVGLLYRELVHRAGAALAAGTRRAPVALATLSARGPGRRRRRAADARGDRSAPDAGAAGGAVTMTDLRLVV